MIPASRIIYTQYKRKQTAKETFPIACNAITSDTQNLMPESYMMSSSPVQEEFTGCDPLDKHVPTYDFTEKHLYKINTISSTSSSSTNSPIHSHDDLVLLPRDNIHNLSRISPFSTPIAILPQYLTQRPTSLTITKHGLSNLYSTFSISISTSTSPLLTIHHSFSSLTPCMIISDARTATPLLTLSRQRNQRPISHVLRDSQGTRTGEIQGNFALPLSGSKRATAVFTNACDGDKISLAVNGGWRGQPAEIKIEDSDELLACVRGQGFGLMRLVHGGRTYEVQIAAGVDVVLIVAMVAALDARAG